MVAFDRLEQLEAHVERQLDQVIEMIDAELEALRLRRDLLNSRIAKLARRRLFHENRRSLSSGSSSVGSRKGKDEYPPKPLAVLAVLREQPDRQWRLVELRRALVERGMMPDDPRHVHALEVAVRALEARADIERPRRGVYRLPQKPAGGHRDLTLRETA